MTLVDTTIMLLVYFVLIKCGMKKNGEVLLYPHLDFQMQGIKEWV